MRAEPTESLRRHAQCILVAFLVYRINRSHQLVLDRTTEIGGSGFPVKQGH
jgi:hypothetical protein